LSQSIFYTRSYYINLMVILYMTNILLIHAVAVNHLEEYSVCQNSAQTCMFLNILCRNHEHLRTLIHFQTTSLHLNFTFKNCFKILQKLHNFEELGLLGCVALSFDDLLCLKDFNACSRSAVREDCFTVKMKKPWASKMSGTTQLRTKFHIPEDFSLQQYCHENLICNINCFSLHLYCMQTKHPRCIHPT
jgi:hypothetical protein